MIPSRQPVLERLPPPPPFPARIAFSMPLLTYSAIPFRRLSLASRRPFLRRRSPPLKLQMLHPVFSLLYVITPTDPTFFNLRFSQLFLLLAYPPPPLDFFFLLFFFSSFPPFPPLVLLVFLISKLHKARVRSPSLNHSLLPRK